MTGGILQLISYGNLDKLFIENPNITFFKKVYLKPTLFSIEFIDIPIDISKNNMTNTYTLQNYGDLLKSLNLRVDIPKIKFDYKIKLSDKIKEYLKNNNLLNNVENIYDNINKSTILRDYLFYNLSQYVESIDKNLLLIYPDGNSNLHNFEYIYNSILSGELSFDKTDELNYTITYEKILNLNEDNLNNILNTTKMSINKIIIFNNSTNIKLKIGNLLMNKSNIYPIFYAIDKNYDILLKKKNDSYDLIKTYNQFNKLFIDSLNYNVLKSNELISYYEITNQPISEIKNYKKNIINTYVLWTQYIINLTSSFNNEINNNDYFIIISASTKRFINLIKINTIYFENNMYGIKCTIFKNDIDKIDTINTYIGSNLNGTLYKLNTKYKIKANTTGTLTYEFLLENKYANYFLPNGILYIFTGNNDKKKLISVFVISKIIIDDNNVVISTIDYNSDIITGSIEILTNNNFTIPVIKYNFTQLNNDVIQNYNEYINSTKIIGLSNERILYNLRGILLSPIKFNGSYLLNFFKNMFNGKNFLMNVSELLYDITSNSFTEDLLSSNTTLKNSLTLIRNYILTNKENSFLYRESNDVEYNYLYEFIKNNLTDMISNYIKITTTYGNEFSNYDKIKKMKYLGTIATLTSNIQLTYPDASIDITNVIINDTFKSEYLIVSSPNILTSQTRCSIHTNSYVLNKINKNTNEITKISVKLYNPSTFVTSENSKKTIILDNESDIYVIKNNKITNLFNYNIKKLIPKFNKIKWNDDINTDNCKLNNIMFANFSDRKYIIDNVNNDNILYYITELNHVVKLELFNYIPTSTFCINTEYYVSGIFDGKSVILGLNNAFDNIAKNSNISYLQKKYTLNEIRNQIIYENYLFTIFDTFITIHLLPLSVNSYVNIIDLNFIVYENDTIIKIVSSDIKNINILYVSTNKYTLYLLTNEIILYAFEIILHTDTQILYTIKLLEKKDFSSKYDVNTNYIFYNNNKYVVVSNTKIALNVDQNLNAELICEFNDPYVTIQYDHNYIIIHYIDKNYTDIRNIIKIFKIENLINELNGQTIIYLDNDTSNINSIIEINSTNESWMKLEILNMSLNNYLYIKTDDNIIYKIIINYNTNTYSIDNQYKHIDKLYMISSYNNYDYISTIDSIYIYASTLNKYLYDIKITNISYSYGKEYILFDDNHRIFKITDEQHSRIIYGKYYYDGDKIIFNNIQSYNIAIENIKMLQDRNIITKEFKILKLSINKSLLYTISFNKELALFLGLNGVTYDNITNIDFALFANNILYCIGNNKLIINDVIYNINNFDSLNQTLQNIYTVTDKYIYLRCKININVQNNNNILLVDTTSKTVINNYGNYGSSSNIYLIPHNTNNIYFNEIKHICLIGEDILIQNNNSLYYIYDTYVYKIYKYDSIVNHICNFYKHIFVYTNDNQLIHLDDLNQENTYTFPTIDNPVINLFALKSDIIALVKKNDDNINEIYNVYIEFYRIILGNNILIKLNTTRYSSTIDNVNDSSFVQLLNGNYIENTEELKLYYPTIDTISFTNQLNEINQHKYLMYVVHDDCIDLEYLFFDFNTNSINVVKNRNKYAKPYYLLKSLKTSDYIKMPEINNPKLMNGTDNYQYIIGHEKSIINIIPYTTITTTSNETIYEIRYYNIKPDHPIVQSIYNYPKDVRKMIDQGAKLILDNGIQINILYKYSKDKLQDSNQNSFVTNETLDYTQSFTDNYYILSNNNNFYGSNTGNYNFYDFHDEIKVYSVDKYIYTTNKIENMYLFNSNVVSKIGLYGISNELDTIDIKYNIELLENNKYVVLTNGIIINVGSGDSITLSDISYNNNVQKNILLKNRIKINGVVTTINEKYVTNINSYYGTDKIKKMSNGDKIIIITNNRYYNLLINQYLNYNIDNDDSSILLINYSINYNIGIYNNFLYIIYDGKRYIGKYANNVLSIYYRIYSNIVWQCDRINFYSYLNITEPYNTLLKYGELYNLNIDNQTNLFDDNKIYNGNVLIMDYIRYIIVSLIDGTNNINNPRIFQEIKFDMYQLLYEIFMKISDIISSDDSTINKDQDRTLYKEIIGVQNLSANNRIYVKYSHNFNNMIGYEAINKLIAQELINKYLFDVNQYILLLFTYTNDDIIKNLKRMSYRTNRNEYLVWNIIEEDKLENRIQHIYDYLKEMIKLNGEYIDEFDVFINTTTLDRCYFLIDNIITFKNIYESLLGRYNLVEWIIIENCIIKLYSCMNILEKILHDNLIFLDENVYLINKYFVIYEQRYDKIIYLDEQIDKNVIEYVYKYINYLFNGYELNGMLIFGQLIVNLYNDTIDNILNYENIGSTTSNNIDKINNILSYDIQEINNFSNTINNTDNSPFILNMSNEILEINTIEDIINDQKSIINDNIKYYDDNKNILEISKVTYDKLYDNYNKYTLNKQNINNQIYILNAQKINDICRLTVNIIGDILRNDYIGIYIKNNIYRLFLVTNVNEIYKQIDIQVDNTFDINDINDIDNPKIIYTRLDSLKLKNKKQSLYSSFKLVNAYCYEIFNNFNQIDNVDYTLYLNWYFMSADNDFIYFTSALSDIQDIQNYNSLLLSRMVKNYSINDLTILQNTFKKVFMRSNMVNTIDDIIYTILQIINPYKYISNGCYNGLYLNYKLNQIYSFNCSFDDLINLNNYNFLMKKMLSNINNLSYDVQQFKFNEILKILNKQNTNNSYDISSNVESNSLDDYLLVSNYKYNNNIYPYCNYDETFCIESILINSTINDKLKLNDIKTFLIKLKKYYGKSTYQIYLSIKQHIYEVNNARINISKQKVMDILTFVHNNKIDIFNSLDNYYYHDCIINKCEQIGYFKLKVQQLIIWRLIKLYFGNNYDVLNYNKYYIRLPRNYLYNYTSNYSNILSDEQITMVETKIDLFMSSMNVDTQYLIDRFDENNNLSVYLEKWDEQIDNMFVNNYELVEISNMVLPCNYYYLAYLMVQMIPEHKITINDYFICTIKNDNVTKIKYNRECIDFLHRQKNKSFVIDDWIGKIKINEIEIPKVFLCNHNYLDSILILKLSNYKLSYNSNVIAYEDINGSQIKMINYLLLTLLRYDGNCVETILNGKLTYPTLYLVNGRLVRTTDLPDGYIYTYNNNKLNVERIQLTKNGINYYNIIQNDVSQLMKKNLEKINKSFEEIDILLTYGYNIDVQLRKTNFSFDILNIEDNLILDKYIIKIQLDVENNFYDKCHCNVLNYYLYIDKIINDSIFTYLHINKKLSKNLDDNFIVNSYGEKIYGGLQNILDKIYGNDENMINLQYFNIIHILDEYNDYYDIFDKTKNYLSKYLGGKYEYENDINITIKDYLNDLISKLHNEYGKYYGFGDFLKYNDLFWYDSTFDNNLPIMLESVNNNIISKNMDLQGIKKYRTDVTDNIINCINFPENTIYNPKLQMGKWTKYLGHNIIDYIEMYVGDEMIQQITGDYLHINYGLNTSLSKSKKYLQNIGYMSELLTNNNELPSTTLYIMLPWFFNKPGIHLPLVSLIHTSVRFKVKFKNLDNLVITNNNNFKMYSVNGNMINDNIILKPYYITEYIYLDEDERIKFAQSRHEYLIQQIQYLSPVYVNKEDMLNGSKTIDLNFKNCVKDIMWYCKTENNLLKKDYLNFTNNSSTYNNIFATLDNIKLYNDYFPNSLQILKNRYNTLSNMQNDDNLILFENISINDINLDWFPKTEYESVKKKIFNIREYKDDGPISKSRIIICGKNLLDHDNIYTTTVIPRQKYNSNHINGLHTYSFSLLPMEDQPSGSLNFSILDDIKLQIELRDMDKENNENNYLMFNVVSRSYNIFRVFSGYGACVY